MKWSDMEILAIQAYARLAIIAHIKEKDRRIAALEAARFAYASEFPHDNEGQPDIGSIHQNIRALKAEIYRLRNRCDDTKKRSEIEQS